MSAGSVNQAVDAAEEAAKHYTETHFGDDWNERDLIIAVLAAAAPIIIANAEPIEPPDAMAVAEFEKRWLAAYRYFKRAGHLL